MKNENKPTKPFEKKIHEIFQMAAPFLDIRHNDVHVQMAYDFAKRLLKDYPEADETIVLPAVILHDVGWKTIPEEEILESFGPRIKDHSNQRRHETEGAKIAVKTLSTLGFPQNNIDEIVKIIDGHDTRREAISLNDQLVKDADKLWRFTPTGVQIDHKRFGLALDQHLAFLDRVVEQWLFTSEAKKMAREALDQVKIMKRKKERVI
jgi:HD superfamily phosphodiesterase